MKTYDDYLISIGDYYDYECPECGRPSDTKGVCSGTCFETSML